VDAPTTLPNVIAPAKLVNARLPVSCISPYCCVLVVVIDPDKRDKPVTEIDPIPCCNILEALRTGAPIDVAVKAPLTVKLSRPRLETESKLASLTALRNVAPLAVERVVFPVKELMPVKVAELLELTVPDKELVPSTVKPVEDRIFKRAPLETTRLFKLIALLVPRMFRVPPRTFTSLFKVPAPVMLRVEDPPLIMRKVSATCVAVKLAGVVLFEVMPNSLMCVMAPLMLTFPVFVEI